MSIVYSLDKSAINSNNYIVGEVKDIGTNDIRVVVPIHAPFFTNNLRVFDASNNIELVLNDDYRLGELHSDITLHLGHEVYQIIIITNTNVSSSIRMNYQVVGGEYDYNDNVIVDLYTKFLERESPIDWLAVTNRPPLFPPSLHTHWLNDIYGFQAVVDALERVRNAISIGAIPTYQALMDWTVAQTKSFAGEKYMLVTSMPTVEKGLMVEMELGTMSLHDYVSHTWAVVHETSTVDDFVAVGGSFKVVLNKGKFTIPSNNTSGSDKTFTVTVSDPDGKIVATSRQITLLG